MNRFYPVWLVALRRIAFSEADYRDRAQDSHRKRPGLRPRNVSGALKSNSLPGGQRGNFHAIADYWRCDFRVRDVSQEESVSGRDSGRVRSWIIVRVARDTTRGRVDDMRQTVKWISREPHRSRIHHG